MAMTVKTTGLRELERTLMQIPLATARNVGRRSLTAGGEVIARRARQLAPVDIGNLRESIDVSTKLAPSQAADKGEVARIEMYVGPGQHPQAITQEFGTWFHPAQPFMRPAWESEKMNALDVIGASLGIEVIKAANRYAKKVAKG